MKLIIKQLSQNCDEAAADYVVQQLKSKANSVLGLATGNTTRGLFETLVKLYRSGKVDFSQVRAFMIDEYVGLSIENPQSIHARIEEQLFKQINIEKNNTYVLNGRASSLEQECERYEEKIANDGGIDLLVLSIGTNGHIGFNEPGTPFGSGVHVAGIGKNSRKVRVDLFGSLENVPDRGLTMGIKNLAQSRRILLMAKGRSKAQIVQRSLYGSVTPEVPSSVLQLHPDLTVILDAEAARKLGGNGS